MSINDSESRERLIECAKKEFLEKGFAKASLRQIAAEAGLTTGAVYFFFKDKDDLFKAVVAEPLQKLRQCLYSHMSAEVKEMDNYTPGMEVDLEDDRAAAIEAVKILFKHKEEFDLLVTKGQGSSLENIVDDMNRRKKIIEKLKRYKENEINDYIYKQNYGTDKDYDDYDIGI